MNPFTFDNIRHVHTIQPHEIRYLREALGWSQAKLARFLSRDTATVYRWEAGQYAPDVVTSGVLLQLWERTLGPYEGPYDDPFKEYQPAQSGDTITALGNVLLAGGVAFFLFKGIEAFIKEQGDGDE